MGCTRRCQAISNSRSRPDTQPLLNFVVDRNSRRGFNRDRDGVADLLLYATGVILAPNPKGQMTIIDKKARHAHREIADEIRSPFSPKHQEAGQSTG
jgi:hypothetical protein